MTLTEKDVKKGSLIVILAVLAILAFLIARPVLMTVIGGLILAYIFFPVYKLVLRGVRYKTIAAILVTILIVAIILVPLWFAIPLLMQQLFQFLRYAQEVQLSSLVTQLFPSASEQLIAQISTATDTAFSRFVSNSLEYLVTFLIDFPLILLHVFLMGFVFFFALRDSDKLSSFFSGLSPLAKEQEKILVRQFQSITSSVLYGQIVLGLLQGILAGLGLLLFGVPNALILTILAIILGVIPLIGPGLVYVPVTLYLLINTNPLAALAYFLYNVVFVSPMDNIARSYLLSRKSDNLHQVIALIGMLGGLLLFGILGIILGPLILAYFITFLKAYKEKTLSSFFSQ